MSENCKFFVCEICGNMTGLIKDKGAPLTCCGSEMTALVPNTVDAAKEKHIPVVETCDCKCDCGCDGDCDCGCTFCAVEVGSTLHPMEDAHYIEFIFVQTEKGGQRKRLKPGDAPKLGFCVADDKPVAVYAYCNLHGLWKVDV